MPMIVLLKMLSHKKGHLAKKCRSSKGKVEPGVRRPQHSQAATHHLEEEDGGGRMMQVQTQRQSHSCM